MPDIQDQFAQFVERWRGYLDCDPAPSNSEHFEEELRDFVRKFIEECCKITCPLCSEGIKLLDESHVIVDKKAGCPTEAIRGHFAWLEEK